MATVRREVGQRQFKFVRWGLIPSWAKEAKIGCSMINARSDTVATKPAFRAAFKAAACLILADGYYEWLKVGKIKQPYLYEVDGGRPFAFAGLWEQWWGPDHQAPSRSKHIPPLPRMPMQSSPALCMIECQLFWTQPTTMIG